MVRVRDLEREAWISTMQTENRDPTTLDFVGSDVTMPVSHHVLLRSSRAYCLGIS